MPPPFACRVKIIHFGHLLPERLKREIAIGVMANIRVQFLAGKITVKFSMMNISPYFHSGSLVV